MGNPAEFVVTCATFAMLERKLPAGGEANPSPMPLLKTRVTGDSGNCMEGRSQRKSRPYLKTCLPLTWARVAAPLYCSCRLIAFCPLVSRLLPTRRVNLSRLASPWIGYMSESEGGVAPPKVFRTLRLLAGTRLQFP